MSRDGFDRGIVIKDGVGEIEEERRGTLEKSIWLRLFAFEPKSDCPISFKYWFSLTLNSGVSACSVGVTECDYICLDYWPLPEVDIVYLLPLLVQSKYLLAIFRTRNLPTLFFSYKQLLYKHAQTEIINTLSTL